MTKTIFGKTFKIINKDTKKGIELTNQYNNARYYSVNQCYGRPSWTKQQIEARIESWMRDANAYDYRILTYCIMNFKCGYRYLDQDSKAWLLVETMASNYAVEL